MPEKFDTVEFQSIPSSQKVTMLEGIEINSIEISIHTFLTEGDYLHACR